MSLALRRALEGREPVAPEDIQVGAQPVYPIFARAIEGVPSRSSHAYQTRIAEHSEILRDRGPGYARESRPALDEEQLPFADKARDLAPMRRRDGAQADVAAQ